MSPPDTEKLGEAVHTTAPGPVGPRLYLAPGSRLGRYEVIALVGEGGMGEVYRAHDTRLARDVALKVLTGSLHEQPSHRERFLREARVMAALNHPNLLAVYDSGEFEGIPYLVTELLEGESLRAQLGRGSVPQGRAVRIAAEVARGLAAAHQRGIVHRDLKPENLFVTREDRIKILDFGLAKMIRLPSDTGGTAPGMVMGTLQYMAPEQLQGKEADERSDLFSLGAIFYEMLTGRAAFERPTPAEIVAAILRDQPEDLVPEPLAGIVRRCLAKPREERTQSALQLIGELDAPGSAQAPTVAPRAVQSLLVLPFDNLSQDPQLDYLSDGLAETLINSLSQLPGMRVLARATAFRLRGSGEEPLALGRSLGMGGVITGRVLRVGERVVIRTELGRVDDETQLWGEQYDGQGDLLAIQEEISRAIVEALRVKLSPEDAARLDRRHGRNPRAYELYLRGRFFLNKRTATSIDRALRTFDEAIAADPEYALAHCGVADACLLLERYGVRDPREVMPRAKAAAARAWQIDDGLAEAHTSLGQIAFYWDWDTAMMERELLRALSLNPGYALTHHWFGFNLGELGRTDQALAHLDEALRLDPLSLIVRTNRGTAQYFGRRYEPAIADLERALELDPTFLVAHQWLGRALWQVGRRTESLAEHERCVELSPDEPECLAGLGHISGLLGRTAVAREMAERVEIVAETRYVSPYWRAVLRLGSGDADGALDALEAACEHRFDWIIGLAAEPIFDELRGLPRFQALLARVT